MLALHYVRIQTVNRIVDLCHYCDFKKVCLSHRCHKMQYRRRRHGEGGAKGSNCYPHHPLTLSRFSCKSDDKCKRAVRGETVRVGGGGHAT